MAPAVSKWDVDFTLALYNKTGKYFIGKDVIDDNENLINRIFAWRVPLAWTSGYVASRVVGRLWHLEFTLQKRLGREFGSLGGRRRTIHMDPMTVITSSLDEDDLVICHDLGPITHPDLFESKVTEFYTAAYAKIQSRRPRMVFISQASHDAFASAYGPPRRARVIYPPLRIGVTDGDRAPLDGVVAPYLLTVGSLGSRKNQEATIKAYAQSGLHACGVQYVLCGSKEAGFERVLALADATPGVTTLAYVSDAQLRWLYHNAAGFVLVSHLEGFGMPVSEAISHSLVPLITRGGVLQEVAGDAALVADPHSIDEIAAQMRDLAAISEPERRARLVRLRQSIERFSHTEIKKHWRDELSS
jgi:glycosyltransferase involved in cell wall biosynthesis